MHMLSRLARHTLASAVILAGVLECQVAPASAGSTTPPFNPAASNSGAARRIINCGSRTGLMGDVADTTHDQWNTTTVHDLPIAGSQFRLLYDNIFVGTGGHPEVDQSPDLTVKAGFRPAGATVLGNANALTYATPQRVFFNGAQTGTALGTVSTASQSSILISDPLPLHRTGNQLLLVNTYATTPAVGSFQLGRAGVFGLGERFTAGTALSDQSISGGNTGSPANTVGPSLILCVPDNPVARSVAIAGDSIGDGTGDTADPTTGVIGWPERALGVSVPNAKFTMPGERFSNWSSRDYIMMHLITSYFTDLVIQLGTNSVALDNNTLAQMQAYVTPIVQQAQAAGLRVYLTTIVPYTPTSTDGWTDANQIVGPNEAVRVAWNNWVRTVPLGVNGVFDVAAVAETSLNSGVWNYNCGTGGAVGACTGEGVHPKSVMHARMALVMQKSTFGY